METVANQKSSARKANGGTWMTTNSTLSTSKPTKRNPHHTLLVMAALLILAVSGSVPAQNLQQNNNSCLKGMQGSWIFTIDRFTQGVTFSALMSFADGGVISATGSIGPPISPILGSWKCTGPNSLVATYFFYPLDAQGNSNATIKNSASLHLDDQNQMVGTGSAFVCDVHGENCFSIPPIHLTGKFIVPEGSGIE
jgi:hypothetical protein